MSMPMRKIAHNLLRNALSSSSQGVLDGLTQQGLRHASSAAMPVEKDGKVLHPDLLNQQASARLHLQGRAVSG